LPWIGLCAFQNWWPTIKRVTKLTADWARGSSNNSSGSTALADGVESNIKIKGNRTNFIIFLPLVFPYIQQLVRNPIVQAFLFRGLWRLIKRIIFKR
tara:strand:- start:38971 stop:39261 length:291 start_codon:yes stop_codon:yes gene_type:complete